jgi:2-hydroxy-6-oxonona-2,4-dienedioate hydrolase
MRISFTDVDGVKTRYYHEGDGYPLVLAHGGGVSADNWASSIDRLAKDFAVYAPDMLGGGFTDSIDLKGEPPQLHNVAHLRTFMDQLGIERCAIGGSSYGALISALTYFDRPERIEKLILIGSASVFHPPEELTNSLEGTRVNATSALGDPTLETCRTRLGRIFYDKSKIPDDVILTQLTIYAQPDRLPYFQQFLDGMVASVNSPAHRVFERLEQIKVPTLTIQGRDDIRAKLPVIEEQHKRLPNSKLVIFDECGHMPHLEHNERFCQLVADFVRS